MAAITAEIKHGTIHGYTNQRCRCDECRRAMREYYRENRGDVVDRERFSDLLHELCPDGLTDDCPARRARRAA